jgi:hypothetical protein
LVSLERTLRGQMYCIDKVAKLGLLPAKELRIARMHKYLEFAAIYRYKSQGLNDLQMLLKAFLSSPDGFGRLFFAKLSAKFVK